jgi:hypothetical protein
MTDFTPIRKLNWRALPLGSRSVYLAVSKRDIRGSVVRLMRLSHLTLTTPSQPGTTSRRG